MIERLRHGVCVRDMRKRVRERETETWGQKRD